MAGETITERSARIGGFTRGFDYLRIGLAIGVVATHSIYSSYGQAVMDGVWASPWTRPLFTAILPMFFALSGFLVAGSLQKRPAASTFLTLRAIRLIPALAVEVLLSALLLGPLLTSWSLADYLADKRFHLYFANIVGWIHYKLPGVFTTLPVSETVNVSLWTIPYELECYVALVGLYMCGVVSRPRLFLGIVAVAIVGLTLLTVLHHNPELQHARPIGRSLVLAFLCGVSLSLFASRVRLDWRLALVSAVAMAALLVRFETAALATIPAAYLTIYLGMLHPPKIPFFSTGDYSYGLYLFAFPIQQAYTLFFPDHRNWLLNLLFTLVFGLLYACFSWWCIEKPILARKGVIVGAVGRIRLRAHWAFAFTRRPVLEKL